MVSYAREIRRLWCLQDTGAAVIPIRHGSPAQYSQNSLSLLSIANCPQRLMYFLSGSASQLMGFLPQWAISAHTEAIETSLVD